jgi:hypothetical protein
VEELLVVVTLIMIVPIKKKLFSLNLFLYLCFTMEKPLSSRSPFTCSLAVSTTFFFRFFFPNFFFFFLYLAFVFSNSLSAFDADDAFLLCRKFSFFYFQKKCLTLLHIVRKKKMITFPPHHQNNTNINLETVFIPPSTDWKSRIKNRKYIDKCIEYLNTSLTKRNDPRVMSVVDVVGDRSRDEEGIEDDEVLLLRLIQQQQIRRLERMKRKSKLVTVSLVVKNDDRHENLVAEWENRSNNRKINNHHDDDNSAASTAFVYDPSTLSSKRRQRQNIDEDDGKAVVLNPQDFFGKRKDQTSTLKFPIGNMGNSSSVVVDLTSSSTTFTIPPFIPRLFTSMRELRKRGARANILEKKREAHLKRLKAEKSIPPIVIEECESYCSETAVLLRDSPNGLENFVELDRQVTATLELKAKNWFKEQRQKHKILEARKNASELSSTDKDLLLMVACLEISNDGSILVD